MIGAALVVSCQQDPHRVSWRLVGLSQAATARKWLGPYLADVSSRPVRTPKSVDPGKALLIVELRKRRMLPSRTALSVGLLESTVSRVLARTGLSRLSDLQPVEPSVRYEHEALADLLHIDSKKPGRTVRPSHRVAGNGHRPQSGGLVQTQRLGKQPVDTSPLATKAEKSPEHLS